MTIVPSIPSLYEFMKAGNRQRELTRENTRDLIMMKEFERSHAPDPVVATNLEAAFKGGQNVKLPFALEVVCKRLAIHGPEQTYYPSVVAWATMVCEDRTASFVSVAYSLHRETKKMGAPYNLDGFCINVVPFGVPTDECYKEYWDNQRAANEGNWLNDGRVWA